MHSLQFEPKDNYRHSIYHRIWYFEHLNKNKIFHNLPYIELKIIYLHLVLGRLIYSFDFEGDYGPAIIIEATPRWKTFSYPKSQSVDEALEFELLKKDGLKFRESKREFVADIDGAVIRSIQLYRTLLHEIGHYVHFLNEVERPHAEGKGIDKWETRNSAYFNIVKSEKENYANRYATNMKQKLTRIGAIPFDKIED